MIKKILLAVYVGIAVLCITPSVHAEEIKTFTANYTVQKDGSVAVEETIEYDFGSENKHGIFRDIPVIKKNEEGKKFILEFSDVVVADENDVLYRFTRSQENDMLHLKIGDPNKTVTGVQTYAIRYTVVGALTYFSDHDEFYWNVTGNGWFVPIQAAQARITLPPSISADAIKVACYTGVSGNIEKRCLPTISGSEVTVTGNMLGRTLSAYEGMTVVVAFPKDIVAHIEPKPYVTFFETFTGKIVLVILILLAIFWYVLLPIWIPIAWYKHGRDPRPPMGIASAWFDTPKTASGRDVTPGETGTLVDESADMDDITATIVDLARRGYLKIIEVDKKSFGLEKQTSAANEHDLQPFEEKLLTGLFEKGDYLALKGAELSTTVESVKSKLYTGLVTEGYFTKNPETIRTLYSVLAGFAMFTFNIPLALSAALFGRAMPKKTPEGAQTAAVAKSLRNFITSQDRQFAFQAKHKLLFEKFLPYAIAFGVEKIWAERFKGIDLKPPDWYVGYGGGRFTSAHFVSSLDSSLGGFRSAATPTRSSSGFSSGFSGGSSGGGGGGGGGGSW